MAITFQDIYNDYTEGRVKKLASDSSYCIIKKNDEYAKFLKLGVRYKIIENSGSADFSNVGAPNNDVGTYFICTNDNIEPVWGSPTATLQTGMSPDEIVEIKISDAYTELNAIAYSLSKIVDDRNPFQAKFIKEYTMYLLYALVQQENQGIDEKRRALEILSALWGKGVFDPFVEDNTITSPAQPVYVGLTNPDLTTKLTSLGIEF